ncbi:Os01g0540101 [Oryza sativa Japonica Group]|uniref:Os01g0540101 protein n=1 Tax=Oryza sativa subsp. japonica TaxID=39947 RepID=A0A0P0V3S1_ORYSJ|nr:Os01g0540101 [Oryza sativa Japonica Group]
MRLLMYGCMAMMLSMLSATPSSTARKESSSNPSSSSGRRRRVAELPEHAAYGCRQRIALDGDGAPRADDDVSWRS